MTAHPDQIRQQIEDTRRRMSDDVNALTDRVSPRRVAGRRMEQTRGSLRDVKNKVMGTASHLGETGGAKATTAGQQMSSVAHSFGDRARSMQHMPVERIEGSPLAAGAIAFGVGVLISSMLPPSQREQQAAAQMKHQLYEHSGQLKHQASDIAHQVQDDLRQPVRQAAKSVGSTAAHGASAVGSQGRSATHEIREQARSARDDFKRR